MIRDNSKVTIVSLHYAPEPTGNAPYVASLAQGLAERGHDVSVLTSHPHYPEWRIREGYGQWKSTSRERGVRLSRFLHFVPRAPRGLVRLLSEVSFGLRVAFARWDSPDVVLLVSPALFATGIVAIRAKLTMRRPILAVWVQDIYSAGITETGEGGATLAKVLKAVEARIFQAADGVAVIHERFRQQVVESLGVEAKDVAVVRNWSHLPAVSPFDKKATRARMGWTENDTIVLHAGNMGAKQALENVVEAARLAELQGRQLMFVLLGDGNRRSQLEALAGSNARLRFVDPLPDEEYQRVMASADILLVNEKEGLMEMSVPSKLTSYFGTGLPVVAATAAGSVTAGEIAISGGGIRVDAGDPQALIETCIALADDSDYARSLGAAGLDFRSAHLSRDRAIDQYADWLRSLAETRARSVGARLPDTQGGNA